MASRFSIEATFTAIDRMTQPVTRMGNVTSKLANGVHADAKRMSMSFANFRQSIFGNLMAYDLFRTAVFSAGRALKFTIDEARKIEDARAAFTPLVGSAEKAAELVDMLNVAAAETPFMFNDISKATKQLLPVMEGDLQKTIDTFKMLGDTAGGNAEKLDSITRGYTKAMLKGKVDMESLNMIAEAGVPIHTELARSMGYGKNQMTEFFKKVSSGTVGTEELTKAFQRMTSEGGIFFQGMIIASKTTSGVISTMEDSISMAAAGIGDALLPVVKDIAIEITKVSAEVLKWVQANKQIISDKVREYWETLKSGLKIIGNVVKFLWDYSWVLEWLIKLWVLYKIVSLAALGAQMISSIVGWIAYIIMMRNAIFTAITMTKGWAIAQQALNFIMSMNPIVLIALAIIALISYIVIAIKYWHDFGAAMLFLIGPIGWIVNLFMIIREHWDNIVQGFQSGGIMGGLKAIGIMLLDFVLMPIQQILELVSKIPGLGDLAGAGAAKIKGLREGFGINVGKEETQSETGGLTGKRQVMTQSQQVAQSINTNKNTNIQTTNTNERLVKIKIDNQNNSSINMADYFYGG